MKKDLFIADSLVALFCFYHLARVFGAIVGGENLSVNSYIYMLLGFFSLSILKLYATFKETGALENGNFIALYLQRKALEEQKKIDDLRRGSSLSRINHPAIGNPV
ncbi:hypothetical protein [Microbulbifer zhoushanensis]|uniref:hypothetical protein n=1 Tax=Microbulbifer zhoushanensis TaxID=2904254 RepID=UPI001F3AA916|nr:hypothetical protein [Microbulbifer zhoushanensis]